MINKAIDKDYLLRQLILFETDVIARKAIASEEGYLGFRFYDNKFAYKSGNSWIDIELGGGGGGDVRSVNGKSGVVVLDASDVGALPDNTDIPEKTSDLTNDSGFITNTVNNLANYYLKSQTYTQAEVDALIAAVKNGRFISVAALPTTDIDTKAIYLVPSADPKTGNVKDEYINTDGTNAGWELIGSTAINLSEYVTDAELTTALANYTTTTDLTTLLSGKVDKIVGKGLSTNDYDDSAKAIVDGVTTALDTKQPKTLSEPIYVDGITKFSVEASIDAINDLAASNKSTLLTKADTSQIAAIQDGQNIDSFSDVETALANKVNTSAVGASNGVASLDSTGKVPSSQLPGYVDDVLEYANSSSFPSTGETGKIYIAKDTNKIYRWSGTAYVVISETLSLGETSSTAYAGNKGKANADAISVLQTTVAGKANSADLANCYQTGDTVETALADGDYFPFYDTSANAKRKTLWSNIKSVLKMYFDGIYSTVKSRGTPTSDGTILSLVNTGDMYNWNHKVTDVENLYTGTPSATSFQVHQVKIVSWSGTTSYTTNIEGSMYMEQSIQTSTTGNVSVTFTNDVIETTSVIDVYTSKYGLNHSNISITNGNCVITFPIQSSASTVTVRIYIK